MRRVSGTAEVGKPLVKRSSLSMMEMGVPGEEGWVGTGWDGRMRVTSVKKRWSVSVSKSVIL